MIKLAKGSVVKDRHDEDLAKSWLSIILFLKIPLSPVPSTLKDFFLKNFFLKMKRRGVDSNLIQSVQWDTETSKREFNYFCFQVNNEVELHPDTKNPSCPHWHPAPGGVTARGCPEEELQDKNMNSSQSTSERSTATQEPCVSQRQTTKHQKQAKAFAWKEKPRREFRCCWEETATAQTLAIHRLENTKHSTSQILRRNPWEEVQQLEFYFHQKPRAWCSPNSYMKDFDCQSMLCTWQAPVFTLTDTPETYEHSRSCFWKRQQWHLCCFLSNTSRSFHSPPLETLQETSSQIHRNI